MNPIAFSTLACPGWQIETVIARAQEFGYDGIEWRGGPQGHVQPNMPGTTKSSLRKGCSEAGLASVAVTAYTSFVSADERAANLDELRHYVDLAAELGAGYVRSFLGELPPGTTPTTDLYEAISACLHSAAEYASTTGVKIAVEPHDDFARSPVVAPVFSQPGTPPELRVIWDIGNAFATGEDPSQGFELLKDRLAYVQVKDGRGRIPNWQLCALGTGDVPLGAAFELLIARGFQGPLSIEWEYAWHPELDPPETALPAALRTVRQLLTTAQREST